MSVESDLFKLKEQGLLRSLRPLKNSHGKLSHNGKALLNFSSNDYLDLANDRSLKTAAIEGITQSGCGAGASRLMSGTLAEHEELENALAEMIGGESALVFGSGFLANLGVMTALAGRDAMVFADRLNHASLVDGTLLSRAKFSRYRHKDMAHLAELLEKHADSEHKIIVSDSVFSMDGDIAPVKELSELAAKHNALLVIDEAHAIGVLGPSGAGVCRAEKIQPDVIVGTLSKSLGSYGGFAVCSATMREYLINRARSFIYSTALPPACITSAAKAIEIICSEENLGAILMSVASTLGRKLSKRGFQIPETCSPIIPIHIGDNEKALEISQKLLERGILTTAVRPPTVPAGTARLRLSVTLAHTDNDLDRLVKALGEIADEMGIL